MYVSFIGLRLTKTSLTIINRTGLIQRGGIQVLHKIFLEKVHSARLSCTANARPLTGFEKGPNLAENRVEYVLLDTLRWKFHLFLSEPNRVEYVLLDNLR